MEDRDVAAAVTARHFLADPGEFGAELLDLLVRTALFPRVTDHPGVELLRALPGLAPLEVADGVGAAGDGLEGPEAVETVRLGVVDAAPVDRSRRLFHQHPGAAGLRAGHVLDEGAVLGAEGVAWIGVDVDGDDVLLPAHRQASCPTHSGMKLVVTGTWPGVCRRTMSRSAT